VRRLLVLLLALLTAVAAANITVRFPVDGKYRVWTAPDFSTSREEGTAIEGESYEFTGVLSEYLFVYNGGTGNIWVTKTRDIKRDWYPRDEELRLAGTVRIRVEHEGRPVKAASVRINGGTPRVIDEAAEGVATFENVRLGEIKVEASFKLGRRDRVRRQSFELPARRDEREPTFVFALTDKVDTIAAPVSVPTPEKTPAATPKAASKEGTRSVGSLLGSILVFVLTLAGAGALLYFGLKWVQNNQEKTAGALNKIGVPMDPVVTDPVAPDPPTAAPVVAGPPQPIVLDPSATPDTPMDLTPPVAAIVLTGGGDPRFVDSQGMPWPIPDGVSTVGRELSNPLNFNGEQTLSRRHAEVVRNGTSVIVRDAGSTNGTFVNGQKVMGDTVLKPGDQVQFGAVRLRFE
jgi:hypothetical protein